MSQSHSSLTIRQATAQSLSLVFSYSVPLMLAQWNIKAAFFFMSTCTIATFVLFLVLPEVSFDFVLADVSTKTDHTPSWMKCSTRDFLRGSSRLTRLLLSTQLRPMRREISSIDVKAICRDLAVSKRSVGFGNIYASRSDFPFHQV